MSSCTVLNLNSPIGGRWNPRADFEQTVLAHAPSIAPEQFAAAISTGDHFFAASASTPDYDDYHRVMLHHLGVPPASQLLADLRCEVPRVRSSTTALRSRRRLGHHSLEQFPQLARRRPHGHMEMTRPLNPRGQLQITGSAAVVCRRRR